MLRAGIVEWHYLALSLLGPALVDMIAGALQSLGSDPESPMWSGPLFSMYQVQSALNSPGLVEGCSQEKGHPSKPVPPLQVLGRTQMCLHPFALQAEY